MPLTGEPTDQFRGAGWKTGGGEDVKKGRAYRCYRVGRSSCRCPHSSSMKPMRIVDLVGPITFIHSICIAKSPGFQILLTFGFWLVLFVLTDLRKPGTRLHTAVVERWLEHISERFSAGDASASEPPSTSRHHERVRRLRMLLSSKHGTSFIIVITALVHALRSFNAPESPLWLSTIFAACTMPMMVPVDQFELAWKGTILLSLIFGCNVGRAFFLWGAPDLTIAVAVLTAMTLGLGIGGAFRQTVLAMDKTNSQLKTLITAKDMFISKASHEIRSPLQSLLSSLDTILEYSVLGPGPSLDGHGGVASMKRTGDELSEIREMLEDCRQAALMAARFTNDFLDLMKYRTVDGGPIPLNLVSTSVVDCVVDAWKVAVPLARERHVTLSRRLEDSLPDAFRCDRFRLTQVLVNLVCNSIKYSASGQSAEVVLEVSVKHISEVQDVVEARKFHAVLPMPTRSSPLPASSAVGWPGNSSSPSSYATFEVSDNGIGIPESLIDRVFEPFVQVRHDREKGTGLGLAIVREIVSAMRGFIYISSSVGGPGNGERGTRILFGVPLISSTSSTPSSSAASSPRASSQGLKGSPSVGSRTLDDQECLLGSPTSGSPAVARLLRSSIRSMSHDASAAGAMVRQELRRPARTEAVAPAPLAEHAGQAGGAERAADGGTAGTRADRTCPPRWSICLCEDDPLMRKAIGRLLERVCAKIRDDKRLYGAGERFEVRCFDSGQSLVAYFVDRVITRLDPMPMLVVTDVQLSAGMDADAALAAIQDAVAKDPEMRRKALSDLTVAVMSGDMTALDAVSQMKFSKFFRIEDRLLKPIHHHRLYHLADRALLKFLSARQRMPSPSTTEMPATESATQDAAGANGQQSL